MNPGTGDRRKALFARRPVWGSAAALIAVAVTLIGVASIGRGGQTAPDASGSAVGPGVGREVGADEGTERSGVAPSTTRSASGIGGAASVSTDRRDRADEGRSSEQSPTTTEPFNITIPPASSEAGSPPSPAPGPSPSPSPDPAPAPPPPGPSEATDITVRARGATGTEQLEVWVGPSRVALRTVGNDFSAHSVKTRAEGKVEVRFVNDGDTLIGNRDLWIDYIDIGTDRFQSEAAGTYASDYWDDASSTCADTEGYPQLDVLRCNGRFRYARLTGGAGQPIGGGANPPPAPTPDPTPDPGPSPDPTPVPSGARYVSTSGSDAYPGTQARPWRTIQHAADVAQPGDVVVVRGGTYQESVHVSRSGAPGAWIEFRNHPGERPVVRATDNPGFQLEPIVSGGVGSLSGAQKLALRPLAYVAVRGFELAGENSTSSAGWAGGVSLGYADHIKVIDNVIHGFPGGGVSATQSGNVLVQGNVISAVGATGLTQYSGVSTYQAVSRGGADIEPGYQMVFRNNTIRDVRTLVTTAGKQFNANYVNVANGGDRADDPGSDGHYTDANCIIVDDGRHTQNGSPFPDFGGRALIEGNRCENNMGRGIHVFESDHVVARNNTLRRNMGANRWYPAPAPFGFDPWEGYRWTAELNASRASDVRFENNVVDNAPGSYDRNSWSSSNVIFRSNRYVGSGIATSRTDGASFVGETTT